VGTPKTNQKKKEGVKTETCRSFKSTPYLGIQKKSGSKRKRKGDEEKRRPSKRCEKHREEGIFDAVKGVMGVGERDRKEGKGKGGGELASPLVSELTPKGIVGRNREGSLKSCLKPLINKGDTRKPGEKKRIDSSGGGGHKEKSPLKQETRELFEGDAEKKEVGKEKT